MRASRTFRPAVDGLETRNLLSGGAVAPQLAEDPSLLYLAGGIQGSWSLPTTLNPNTFQTQTLVGHSTAPVIAETASGTRLLDFELKLNPSPLTMPPFSTGGVAVGTLNLTLTQKTIFGPINENVKLYVSDKVERATHDFQIIEGKLTFPTTYRNPFDRIGQETITLLEFVNKSKDSGSFTLGFRRR